MNRDKNRMTEKKIGGSERRVRRREKNDKMK